MLALALAVFLVFHCCFGFPFFSSLFLASACFSWVLPAFSLLLLAWHTFTLSYSNCSCSYGFHMYPCLIVVFAALSQACLVFHPFCCFVCLLLFAFPFLWFDSSHAFACFCSVLPAFLLSCCFPFLAFPCLSLQCIAFVAFLWFCFACLYFFHILTALVLHGFPLFSCNINQCPCRLVWFQCFSFSIFAWCFVPLLLCCLLTFLCVSFPLVWFLSCLLLLLLCFWFFIIVLAFLLFLSFSCLSLLCLGFACFFFVVACLACFYLVIFKLQLFLWFSCVSLFDRSVCRPFSGLFGISFLLRLCCLTSLCCSFPLVWFLSCFCLFLLRFARFSSILLLSLPCFPLP